MSNPGLAEVTMTNTIPLPYGGVDDETWASELVRALRAVLTQHRATALAEELGRQYDVVVTCWSRRDVEDRVKHERLTDAQWRAVQETEAWQNLPQSVYAWVGEAEILQDAIEQAGLELK